MGWGPCWFGHDEGTNTGKSDGSKQSISRVPVDRRDPGDAAGAGRRSKHACFRLLTYRQADKNFTAAAGRVEALPPVGKELQLHEVESFPLTLRQESPAAVSVRPAVGSQTRLQQSHHSRDFNVKLITIKTTLKFLYD